jgi:CRP/FNR family nitrogen fixation transcriptional regulator
MVGAYDGGSAEAEMSRRDIADYLSLTLETVSRALSEFHRKGNLKGSGGFQREITVLNATGLAELDR